MIGKASTPSVSQRALPTASMGPDNPVRLPLQAGCHHLLTALDAAAEIYYRHHSNRVYSSKESIHSETLDM
jgi:hypothetical protein